MRNVRTGFQPNGPWRGLLGQQAPAITFHGSGLRPAADQHQQNECGNKIEVDEAFVADEPAIERSAVSAGDPQRDGKVDMHHASAHRVNRAPDEITATREYAQERRVGKECRSRWWPD